MNYGGDLYKAGVSYYASGTIKNGRKIAAYYFRLSKPATVEQLNQLKKLYPQMTTGNSYNEFAPEIQSPVLIFWKRMNNLPPK